MRLLNATTYKFHEYVGCDVPEYAILSHTWGEGEVTFHDMRPEAPPETWKTKLGWDKIEKCCRQALKDSIQFVWVDTCCIDKSSSAELQEAINSMFNWYEESTECYVFVVDFDSHHTGLWHLGSARWWTRGWTLQELLAPESVRFFDSQWREFGDKVSLRQRVASITGISENTLLGTVVGARQALNRVSVAQRMSWAAGRKTTRAEDMAYSLLGVFGVHMPLLYGEGGTAAFHRLQVEIMGSSPDQSLLAWGFMRSRHINLRNALATSPLDFTQCRSMIAWGVDRSGDTFTMTQRGLRLRLPVVLSVEDDNLIYLALSCTVSERIPPDGDIRAARVLAVPFLRIQTPTDGIQPHSDEYHRLLGRLPFWVPRASLAIAPRMDVIVPRVSRHMEPAYQPLQNPVHLQGLPADWYVAGIFPPETYPHEMIFVRPQASESAGVLTVHFVSGSRRNVASDFVFVVGLQKATKHGEDPIQCATSEPTIHSAAEFSFTVKQYWTPATLRETVLSVVAHVVQVDIRTLSEETGLFELGVEINSLVSLEIRDELAHIFKTNLNLVSVRGSIGDIIRQLRFVTRPRFAVVGDRPEGWDPDHRGGLEWPIPVFQADEVKYCFVEVPKHFSLADLGVGGDTFWSGLHGRWKALERSSSESITFIQTPLEGVSIGIKIDYP